MKLVNIRVEVVEVNGKKFVSTESMVAALLKANYEDAAKAFSTYFQSLSKTEE